MVLLETLKPSLNHLYQTEDAEIISENNLDGHPTDVLRINLK
ncbi:putative Acyl-CoA N-acyltransferase (plasmid) [Legionella adelaidensis]|uniref:Putative Acyl-CoA N-acyltransferase n=2 Tax=Legionella adelaidensis TaxID=45056 RepID=A0A448NBA1_9GAMM|nr:putative Acyl-CoA N-acyltransferase [Legionella adelaidensis]